MMKQSLFGRFAFGKSVGWVLFMLLGAVHGFAAPAVLDLGDTSIQGKRASPEIYFILSTSPVEFEHTEVQPDVVDEIEQAAHELPF
ncbi:MAG: hypothetical protein AAF320_06200 [Myxococcota bacterium]